ncbi:MAG TPA: hypothetical protein DCZ03_04060 [Gammaproteobacteria bacterium]|nr:hypothetical protein [Gammaproteobacteria bacterium]
MKNLLLKPVIVATLFASPAQIQAAEAPERRTFALDKITVSATLTEKKLADVTSSVSIIDSEQLDRQQASDIRDAIRYEPGITTPHSGRFGLRGFNIRGMEGNRVKIIVDGVEQAKELNTGGPFLRANRQFVDLDTLKQIDVVKGPSSSLYGSDALGGVVAFTTKDPLDFLHPGAQFGGSVKFQYHQDNNAFSETLALANKFQFFETLVLYTRRDGDETANFEEGFNDGQGDDRTLPDPVEFSSNNYLAKIYYQPNEEWRVGLIAEHFSSEVATELLSLEGPTYSTTFNYADYTGDDGTNRDRISFLVELKPNRFLFDDVHSKISWQSSQTEQDTRNFTNFAGYGHRLIDYSHEEVNREFSLLFHKRLPHHTLTYGTSYQQAEMENITDKFYLDGTRPADLSRYTPVIESDTFGIFIQDQISLADKRLMLTPSIRYDKVSAEPTADSRITVDFDGHQSDKTTARLGMLYQLTANHRLFAQYSQGFKAPDISQLYHEETSSASRGYVILANPELNPESSDSYELGFRSTSDTSAVEFSIFYNQFDDFIESISTPGTFAGQNLDVNQYHNIAEATIQGAELRHTLWFDTLVPQLPGLSLNTSIAYTEGEDDTNGEPLQSIAPEKAVVSLAYLSADENWGMALHNTLVASKDESDMPNIATTRNPTAEPFSTPGFGLLDFTLFYKPVPALTVRGGVFNVTDKKYWLYEDVRGRDANETFLDRFTQPGRHYSLSLTYDF